MGKEFSYKTQVKNGSGYTFINGTKGQNVYIYISQVLSFT